MSAQIIRLSQKDSTRYFAFLKRGLQDDESSFRITANDDAAEVFPTAGAADSFTLAAVEGDTWLGVASFAREGINREKLRHKGLLFRMYVAPEARGKGVAALLINEIVSRAEKLRDIEAINLTVIASNTSAARLYARMGFKIYGTEVNAVKWKGEYFDELMMAKKLNRHD